MELWRLIRLVFVVTGRSGEVDNVPQGKRVVQVSFTVPKDPELFSPDRAASPKNSAKVANWSRSSYCGQH